MKETDEASAERLEALRQEIAEVQEKLNVQKAGWLNQKNAIDRVQDLKAQLDQAKSEEERATRDGDLARASELRFSVIRAWSSRCATARPRSRRKRPRAACRSR